MNKRTIIEDLINRYPRLAKVEDKIEKGADCLIDCFSEGRKILLCGNGGSSSDCDHITGELLKGFEHKRPLEESLKKKLELIGGGRGKHLSERLQKGFPAISLTAHTSLLTAFANDVDPDLIFAQQVSVYGNNSDVLIAISTSGNSRNIIDAIITAKAKGMTVIGLTGETGGEMKTICDILINVPETRTSYVQELHFPVYHALCLIIENYFFPSDN